MQIAPDLAKISYFCKSADFDEFLMESSSNQISPGMTNKCVLCTIVVRIVQNFIQLKSKQAAETFDYFVCDWFGGVLQDSCYSFADFVSPNIVKSVMDFQNPDVVCRELRLCQNDNGENQHRQCYLLNQYQGEGEKNKEDQKNKIEIQKESDFNNNNFIQNHLTSVNHKQNYDSLKQQHQQQQFFPVPTSTTAPQTQPDLDPSPDPPSQYSWKLMGYLLDDTFGNFRKSPIDLDGDSFSTVGVFRGSNWKGVDCDDTRSDVYPGSVGGKSYQRSLDEIDYNCNGIPDDTDSIRSPVSGSSVQTQYCLNSKTLGLAILGDSAGAHFQFPQKYINASLIHHDTFNDFLYNLYNQFDSPQTSGITGFISNNDNNEPQSLYKKLIEHNQCNYNDYHNLARNGVDSFTVLAEVENNLQRSSLDPPMIVILQLLANDVCKKKLSEMTTPEQFKDNILKVLAALDKKLPPSSHVLIVGVIDGYNLYKLMHSKTHPIDITYEQFYGYLNCMEVNPCATWLNKDQSIRQQTSNRAQQLNDVYREIVSNVKSGNEKYDNFDLDFYEFPFGEILNKTIESEGNAADLVTKFDGFHPSQKLQEKFGLWLWDRIKQDHSDWIGDQNSFNEQIIKQFRKQKWMRMK